jgi:hypothetical protein
VEDIVLEIGPGRENISKRREDVEDLATRFRDAGRSVAIQERTPPIDDGVARGPDLTSYIGGTEALAIFIGTNIASGLIGAVIGDIYKITKRWALERFQKANEQEVQEQEVKSSTDAWSERNSVRLRRSERITIVGPDGKTGYHWEIDEYGNESAY